MRKLIAGLIAVAIFVPAAAQAQVTQVCGDSAPPTILVPDGSADKAAAKCLKTITKSSTKFVQTKLKIIGKCMAARELETVPYPAKLYDEVTFPGTEPAEGLNLTACPDAKGQEKIEKAANKGVEKIAKLCDATALSGLPGTTYASGFTATDVGSCTLSQDNVSASLIAAKLNGITDRFSPAGGANPGLEDCADALSKETGKFIPKILKTINKCIDKAAKAGTAGDVSTLCAPSYAGGAYVAPTETKTAGKIEKTISKTLAAIDKGCPTGTAEGEFGFLPRLHACPYAATVEDLKECMVCGDSNSVWAQVNEILAHQYAETGSLVSPGADAIQNAHDAASVGDKLLIASGTYNEDVEVSTNGIQFVGCGGASNDRPVIEPGGGSGTSRGFNALDVDDLVFQSLTPNNWDSDGIFVSGVSDVDFADNVVMRDIVADGEINSRYVLFPAHMNGVLIELSDVFNCDDAAIYVGKSANIVTRWNRSHYNVAGIEVENCDNAETYNNHSYFNAAGLLVFLDSTLLPRSNDNNHTFHNLVNSNNTVNFAPSGFVANLFQGSGTYLISPSNNTFSYNHVADNQAAGLLLVDQAGVNVFAGSPWPEADGVPGDVCTNNTLDHNTGLDTNGTIPDPDIGFGITLAAVYNEENREPPTGASNTGNCFDITNEPSGVAFILGGANDCP